MYVKIDCSDMHISSYVPVFSIPLFGDICLTDSKYETKLLSWSMIIVNSRDSHKMAFMFYTSKTTLQQVLAPWQHLAEMDNIIVPILNEVNPNILTCKEF